MQLIRTNAQPNFPTTKTASLTSESLMASPGHLVIFDVDGTLIQSIGMDDRCFSQAVSDVLGVRAISTDWASYQYQTDAGLVFEIASKHSGSPPSEKLTVQVRDRFIELLRQESDVAGFVLNEVPGASAVLDFLSRHPTWSAAIATGGWRTAAKLKLQLAGVNVGDIPFASSDDAMPREEIIQCAVGQAEQQSHPNGFEKIVYVGDGSWDAVAAERLGIGFVGVRSNVAKLAFDTETPVVADFNDPQLFVRLLDSITMPQAPKK